MTRHAASLRVVKADENVNPTDIEARLRFFVGCRRIHQGDVSVGDTYVRQGAGKLFRLA